MAERGSWREESREVLRGFTYVSWRCGWCRRLAVTIVGVGERPTACCCNAAPRVAPPSSGRDPNDTRRRWP